LYATYWKALGGPLLSNIILSYLAIRILVP
jgi:hypothetical protein